MSTQLYQKIRVCSALGGGCKRQLSSFQYRHIQTGNFSYENCQYFKVLRSRLIVKCGEESVAKFPLQQRTLAQIQSFLQSNFLVLGLIVSLVAGLRFPQTASSLNQVINFGSMIVFVISGACVGVKDVQSIPFVAVLYGLVSILLVMPLLSLCLFHSLIQIGNSAVGQALMIYACGPTALSTGVSLTQVLGGNISLALLLVMMSNLLVTFTIPSWIPYCLDINQSIPTTQYFDPVQQMIKLSSVIVLPLIAGMSLRIPFGNFVDKHRTFLSNINAICLCSIIWIQIGKCVMQSIPIKFIDGVEGFLYSGIQHGIFLLLNFALARILLKNCEKKVQQVVTLVSSQKALQVCVVVLAQLTQLNIIQSNPVYLLAPIIAHFVQIFMDSFLVRSWVGT